MSELILLLAAEIDIQEAFAFFDNLKQGRGDAFLASLDSALGQLRLFSGSGRLFYKAYRRLLVPKFNCAVFYCVEGRRVIVAAVMDVRQNPEAIYRRLR